MMTNNKRSIGFFMAVLAIYLLVLTDSRLNAGVCPVCKQVYSDSYNFCIIDGAPLNKTQIVIVDTPKTKTRLLEKSEKDYGVAETTRRMQEEEVKTSIKNEVKQNTFDYGKTLKAIRLYFDIDKKITLFLLDYIYERYPEDIEVLKLFSSFYISIDDYGKALKYLDKAEKLIEKKIAEQDKNNLANEIIKK